MKLPVALRSHLSVEQIRERLFQSKNDHHASYWQIIRLISPVCNTADMNELLRGLSDAYREEEILVFADSAGWHQSKELQKPDNIQLELLPPYSPELNPTEHLWDYIREQKGFNNHIFDSM